jgi:hypothetical protein
MQQHSYLTAALFIPAFMMLGGNAFAQAPQWLLGEWTMNGPSRVSGESDYEV